jgi:TonB family protein
VSFQTINRLSVVGLLLSASLQTVGTATFANRDVPQSSGSGANGRTAGCAMRILSDTNGVDFNPYLRELHVSVKKHWFAVMPQSVQLGEQGITGVEFNVLQDGSVPKDSLKLVSGSGKASLDDASLDAVRKAAPFSHLPEKFSQPFIALRLTFYYNLPIPQNPK